MQDNNLEILSATDPITKENVDRKEVIEQAAQGRAIANMKLQSGDQFGGPTPYYESDPVLYYANNERNGWKKTTSLEILQAKMDNCIKNEKKGNIKKSFDTIIAIPKNSAEQLLTKLNSLEPETPQFEQVLREFNSQVQSYKKLTETANAFLLRDEKQKEQHLASQRGGNIENIFDRTFFDKDLDDAWDRFKTSKSMQYGNKKPHRSLRQ